MNKQIAIFDIDGTIADDRWRRHHLLDKKNPARFSLYHQLCGADVSVHNTSVYWDQLRHSHELVIMTGRPIEYSLQTIHWLRHWGFTGYRSLCMRPKNDFTTAVKLKEKWLNLYLDGGYTVTNAFDDDDRNLEMFRQMGVHTVTKVDIND